MSLRSSVTSPHPAQASGPGCGPSLSLSGGPAGGWSGGCFLPHLMDPPSQDLGSVKDQGRDSASFVGWKRCLWRGPGVLFGPKRELRGPGSYLPPGGAQAPSLAGPELPVSIQPPVPSPGKAAPSCPLSSGSTSPRCPALLPALHGGVVGCMHVSDLRFQHERK